MNQDKQKQIRNYIITGSVIFLLSAIAIGVIYAEGALCGKTCRAELAAEAAKKNQKSFTTSNLNLISIIKSKACERTNCVSTEYLVKNYDTSDFSISGGFTQINGKYEREDPPYQQSTKLYDTNLAKPHNGTIVFVDPDMYTLARSKQIIIETTLKDFLIKGDKKTELDHHKDQRKVYHYVWFDSCAIARVGWAENGTFNLPKVIQYMKDGCTGILDIKNMTETIITKKAPRDYCGQECQHQKFMKEAKQKAKSNQLGDHIKIKESKMIIKKQTTKS